MFSIGVIIYIAFCCLVGLCGIHRRMGFIGTFLITFVVSPPIMMLILLLTGPSTRHFTRYR